MEKISDIYLWMSGIIATGGSWMLTRIFRSIELCHSRIDKVESFQHKVVDKAHLESQLVPIRQDVNMILQHLLKHREYENQDHKEIK